MDHEPGVPCTGSWFPTTEQMAHGQCCPTQHPHTSGTGPRLRVSLHHSQVPLAWAWLELDLLQQLQEPPAEQPLCPSKAQNLSLMGCETQQWNRIKVAAKIMRPPVPLTRADLLYWGQLASKSHSLKLHFTSSVCLSMSWLPVS